MRIATAIAWVPTVSLSCQLSAPSPGPTRIRYSIIVTQSTRKCNYREAVVVNNLRYYEASAGVASARTAAWVQPADYG